MIHKANINILIDIHTVEKISLGTHWPHPLWVITPSRISRLTPDLAEGRHWKATALLLYMFFSVCCKRQNWGDFEGVLHYTVSIGQGLADTGTWEFFVHQAFTEGQVRQARWLFYCLESSWLLFKAGTCKCHTTWDTKGIQLEATEAGKYSPVKSITVSPL